ESGMAMAARIPMIATTIISSIRVKPRWLRPITRRFLQKLSIQSSSECTNLLLESPPSSGRAWLRVRGQRRRGSAGLGDLDGDETERTRIDRHEGSPGGIVRFRGAGLSGVVDEHEPIDDLVGVDLFVVLDL